MSLSIRVSALLARLAALLVCLAAFWAGLAHADDVIVDARTSFDAYEVRSPGVAAFMTRRRLVQTLGLSWARAIGDRRPLAPGPRIVASVRLRLDQDFGDNCLVMRDYCLLATEPRDGGAYQPLATDTDVDAPEAWVGVRGLPYGGFVRLGRHLKPGTMGFLRLDGATARIEPRAWLAAEAYGGALVRATSLAGSGAFEPQGAIRLDLDVPDRVSFVDDPITTWAVGGAVELGHTDFVRGRMRFRQTFESTGLVSRLAALSLASVPAKGLHLSADGVWDVHDGRFVDLMAGARADVSEHLALGLTAERHRPRFDWGTIWPYFDLVPISEGSLSAVWRPTGRFALGGSVRARHASFGAELGDETDAGGEGHLTIRVGGLGVHVNGFVTGGDLGPVAGVLTKLDRSLASWVRADLRASVWHFDDPLREGLYGTSVSEALGLDFRLSDPTSVRFSLEHAHSRVVGHRMRALAVLGFEVWR